MRDPWAEIDRLKRHVDDAKRHHERRKADERLLKLAVAKKIRRELRDERRQRQPSTIQARAA